MFPYRLEMSTKLPNERGEDLYDFWGSRIAEKINAALAGHTEQAVINLASNEYFKSVDTSAVAAPVVTIHFKELRDSKYRTIALFAKKARGMMTEFVIRNGIDTVEKLKDFTSEGYCFAADMSDERNLTFIRSS
jgi:cytoplasmic iron level regulating protein YaaA (DUF328/UPF0246 family)